MLKKIYASGMLITVGKMVMHDDGLMTPPHVLKNVSVEVKEPCFEFVSDSIVASGEQMESLSIAHDLIVTTVTKGASDEQKVKEARAKLDTIYPPEPPLRAPGKGPSDIMESMLPILMLSTMGPFGGFSGERATPRRPLFDLSVTSVSRSDVLPLISWLRRNVAALSALSAAKSAVDALRNDEQHILVGKGLTYEKCASMCDALRVKVPSVVLLSKDITAPTA